MDDWSFREIHNEARENRSQQRGIGEAAGSVMHPHAQQACKIMQLESHERFQVTRPVHDKFPAVQLLYSNSIESRFTCQNQIIPSLACFGVNGEPRKLPSLRIRADGASRWDIMAYFTHT